MVLAIACGRVTVAGAEEGEEISDHVVDIDVAGALAHVRVTRRLRAGDLARDRAGRRHAYDVDLPERAVLLTARVFVDGRALESPKGEVQGAAADPGTLDPPADSGTDERLWLADLARAAGVEIQYSYLAPLSCDDGRFVLRVPGNVELTPSAAEVRARVALPAAAPALLGWEIAGTPQPRELGRRRPWSGRARAPRQAAWELSFSLTSAGEITALATRAPGLRRRTSPWWVTACRGASVPAAGFPTHLVALVDVSRSLDAAGLAAVREALLGVVKALPPSLRLSVLLFDRSTERLFALPRLPTGETLARLREALVPDRLRNGTRLVPALQAAAGLLPPEHESLAGPAWLLLLTDGALASEDLGTTLADEISGLVAAAPAGSRAAVLLVRASGEEPPRPAAVEALRRLPVRLGGVTRRLSPSDIRTHASAIVTDLRRGGDLHALVLEGGAASTPAPFAPALAPGEGAVAQVLARGPLRLSYTQAGRAGGARVWARESPRDWPLSVAVPRQLGAAFWQKVAAAGLAEDDKSRGELERSVVRNALSLALLPRVRACYMTRAITDAASRTLTGRVRLGLHLERGEMTDAVILASDLGRPDLEACAREAAFSLQVPRPMRRDHPVLAILNLVFRPHTPLPGDTSPRSVDQDIDVLLGPVTMPRDPRELLQDGQADGADGAPSLEGQKAMPAPPAGTGAPVPP